MVKWLVILTSFFVTQLSAQTKELTIIIDTLIFQFGQEDKLKLRVGKQGFLNYGEDFDSTQFLTFKTFPNYTNKIKLDHDSSIIEIPIDKNGSHIKLKNFYKVQQDTLIISKLTIFETKAADSTFTATYFYKKINGQLAEKPYKAKFEKSGNYYIPPRENISLVINGVEYKSRLTIASTDMEVMHGHGYKPRKFLDKNGDYKKRLTYIYIDQRKYLYFWTGEMEFKE
jgi:hypothetical protein